MMKRAKTLGGTVRSWALYPLKPSEATIEGAKYPKALSELVMKKY
jgi:hypothetical protein